MEPIYFRKWVSGEGKRLDSENKHIFLQIRIFVISLRSPLVPRSLRKSETQTVSGTSQPR